MHNRVLYQGRWLRMKQQGQWEFAERVNPGGAVAIIALTKTDHLLLVEQPRIPINCRTIELPAGLIGDIEGQADESLLTAAQRELEEETGYRCQSIRHLHSGPTSAGMSNEVVHFVQAIDLHKVSAGGGDESEDITVHEIPLEDIATWLANRAAQGDSIDPKLMTGLWLLDHPGPFNTSSIATHPA